MKKLLSLVLALAMSIGVCSLFASCGETETQDIKFGLIALHDENSTYDKNFIDAFKAACQAQGLSESQYLIKTGIPEDATCEEAAEELVDEGCNLIFADSFGHEPFILNVAKKNPNVQFFHATGTTAHTENVANFHNAFASIYEGRYIAGVAAGMKLQEMINNNTLPATAKKNGDNYIVGYVGAWTYAEVISGFTSWFLGVRSIVHNVEMKVQFTGSWYDEALEKTTAQTLIAEGAAIVSQHADSWGAPTACEDANIPNVSYNGSTATRCPNTFIISSRINWQPYFELVIQNARNNATTATDWTGGLGSTLANGSVALTELGAAAAEGTQTTIDEVVAQLKAGTLKVFDTSKFTVNGQALTTYMADVDTDAAFTGDTEAIVTENGVTYFAESKYRSAPYFDIKIDGITYLNTKI